MIENQALEITNYVAQVEELEETIPDLHNIIIDSKSIPNSETSEDDLNKLQ